MRKAILTALTMALVVTGAVVAFGSSNDGQVPTTTVTTTTTTGGTEDISGPCDEAEHANDPRCTGGIPVGDDDRVDNSGPGSLNSGPGSVNSGHDDDGDDDNSGHDDDGDDDNSGHGSSGSGGDDDSSGQGSGGEDD